ICTVMEKIMLRLGYQGVTHTSPTSALHQFGIEPDNFQLVITNLNMPGISGIDFATELLKIRPSLPVLLTTGYCDSVILEKSQRVGIRDVVAKPILLPKLA